MKDKLYRTIVKSFTWRILAVTGTYLIALFVTNSSYYATTISIFEFFTKMGMYFIHERFWNQINLGKTLESNSFLKNLIKTICWRLFATLGTLIISYLITKQWTYSISIASIEAVSKFGLYYIHEQMWSYIRWGKESNYSFHYKYKK